MTPDETLGALEPVDLAELTARAAALIRTDRKYVVPREVAARLVRHLADDHRVLCIDGRRSTSYRSTYFDTSCLRTCRDHVQGRRRRWKVRSRLYVEDALCRLEVKVKSTRGATVKAVAESSPDRYGRLGEVERAFVDEVLGGFDFAVPTLQPTYEICYRRATLADLEAGTRVTVDTGLAFGRSIGSAAGHAGGAGVEGDIGEGKVWLDERFTVVETKGGALPGRADRFLVAAGHRPQAFSKYVASASVLRDDLPDNDVRRMLGRQLHRTPPLPDPLLAPTGPAARTAS